MHLFVQAKIQIGLAGNSAVLAARRLLPIGEKELEQSEIAAHFSNLARIMIKTPEMEP